MTSLEQAIGIVQGVSPSDKVRLLTAVARDPDVIFNGIAVTPGVCGGSPRVAGTRIPVWVLEAHRRGG